MRVAAAIWLLVGFVFCLGQLPISAKGNGINANPSFSTKGATASSYGAFIEALRAALRAKSTRNSHGIPVLSSSLPDSQRFVEVDLTGEKAGAAITLAIDAVNVYVVAYRSGSNSYFLSDAPKPASDSLFPRTNKKTFTFSGNYQSLESLAGKYRDKINLGLYSLSEAISTLSKPGSSDNYNEVATELLVVIQMISEAARFRFIERRMRFRIKDSQNKPPDTEILKLENSWSPLSEQIQSVPEGRLAFNRAVEVRDKNNKPIKVDTLKSPYVANVALLLYDCDLPKTIRMPLQLPVGADDLVALEADDRNKICSKVEPTTWISGRDGFCVDITNGGTNNGNPVQILACGNNENKQKWTFHGDGTIRSLGKCMVASGPSSGAGVTIYDCARVTTDNKLATWIMSMDGSFTNSISGFVLTAAAQGTQLTVTANRYSSYQGWNVGSRLEPLVTNIVGYDDLCLEAGRVNNPVWIEGCVVAKTEQEWAFYNDGTIRVSRDRSLCLTSGGTSTNIPISIATCVGSANQRWVFTTDATFLNPNAKMVMEVKNSNPSLKEIILSAATKGKASQEWLPFLV